tara:strand:+ start:1093 stop:1263 length:171 start_codon:yes stop_codon:yes gene_type:complete
MYRWFIALTPLTGAILFPVIVSLSIAKISLAAGVISALLISTIWFVVMLVTSEMPH